MNNQYVMNKSVDQSQEIIRLKDEIGELKEHRDNDFLVYQSVEKDLKEKAKAWDDLEALVKSSDLSLMESDSHWLILTNDRGINDPIEGCNLLDVVSNALESIGNKDNA